MHLFGRPVFGRPALAAGALICERAGLRVLELPVHENLPWGILVARPELAEPLLELVGGP